MRKGLVLLLGVLIAVSGFSQTPASFHKKKEKSMKNVIGSQFSIGQTKSGLSCDKSYELQVINVNFEYEGEWFELPVYLDYENGINTQVWYEHTIEGEYGSEKINYQYNENNDLEWEGWFYKDMENEDFQIYERTEYIYSAPGLLSSSTWEHFNADSNRWMYQNTTFYYYNINNQDSLRVYGMEGSSKSVYEYSNDTLVKIQKYDSVAGEWITRTYTTFNYASDGYSMTSIVYDYENIIRDSTKLFFDQSSNVVIKEEYRYDWDLNQVVPSYRTEYLFREANSDECVNNGNLGLWLNDSNFRNDLYFSSFTRYRFENGNWVQDELWSFEYNNIKDNIKEMAKQAIFISPNPSKERIKIQWSGEANAKLNIYNQVGAEVANDVINNGQYYDVSSLPKGIYFLTISKDGEAIGKSTLVVE